MWTRLWQRLMNIFKAKANDALDNAEDPIQMMKLAIAEMEISINKSTDALAKAMANQKNLQKKHDELKAESNSWYTKATQAIKSGQDELGKKNLEKKSLTDKQVEQYGLMAQQSLNTVDQLKIQLDRMRTKLDEAKAKESILIAKVENAKAHKEIGQQLGGNSFSPLSEFKKYEEKINKLESEAEAYTELSENKDRLEREFEALGQDEKVYTDFEEIKRNLAEQEQKRIEVEEVKKHKKIETLIDNSKPIQQLPSNEKKQISQTGSVNKSKLLDDFFNKPENE